jgi:hypothetical protein
VCSLLRGSSTGEVLSLSKTPAAALAQRQAHMTMEHYAAEHVLKCQKQAAAGGSVSAHLYGMCGCSAASALMTSPSALRLLLMA